MPGLVGQNERTARMRVDEEGLEVAAVIWLSEVTGKSILKLDSLDYRENHLSSLLARYQEAGPLNGEVFNALVKPRCPKPSHRGSKRRPWRRTNDS